MPISFVCGQCQKSYVVSDGLAGKKAACKQCGNRMTIPGSASSDQASAPSSPPPRQTARPVSQANSETPVAKVRPSQPQQRPTQSTSSQSPKVAVARTVRKDEPNDICGLDEEPSALPPLRPMNSSQTTDAVESTVKKKKKSKGFFASKPASKASSSSNSPIGGRAIWAVVVVSIGIGGFIWSRAELSGWLDTHFTLAEKWISILKTVKDVPSAQGASPKIIDILSQISENLEKNGHKKYSKSLVKNMEDTYRDRRIRVESEVTNEMRRISMIPGAVMALNIEGPLQRLANLEQQLAAESIQNPFQR